MKDTFNIIVELSRMQTQAIDRVLDSMKDEQKPKESMASNNSRSSYPMCTIATTPSSTLTTM